MAAFPTLSDVRAFARMPSSYTADDAILTDLLDAAYDALAAEVGDIQPVSYDEYHNGGEATVRLWHTPILDVQLVEEGYGSFNRDLELVQVNSTPSHTPYAYSVDMPKQGMISRRSVANVLVRFVPGERNIHVVYRAGRAECPAALREAVLALTVYWYQHFEQRGVGTEPASQAMNEDFVGRVPGITSVNMGIPYQILQLIRRYRRPPVIG